MTFPKLTIVGLCALMATASAFSQQHFPLRSGEWTLSMPDPTEAGKTFSMLLCMNDETWAKAISGRNPTCTVTQLNIGLTGGSYQLSCAGKSFQMKGGVKLTFDGLTHIHSVGSIDTTTGGTTTHMDTISDYTWKGPVCDPNADINLKVHHVPPSQ
ncbi:MAG: DUF3617 family protein [Terracidiphilus sp.]|jgi:hypothetical protein